MQDVVRSHWQECSACSGVGLDSYYAMCWRCRGAGRFPWRSFREFSLDPCYKCSETKPLDAAGLCRECLALEHLVQCGCEAWASEERALGLREIVCKACDDTHEVFVEGRGEQMCTRCPTPCQECRQDGRGPYCQRTPCLCSCHVK